MIKFTDKDLKEIREFAMSNFINGAVTYRNERLFLTQCFANAIMAFLTKHYDFVRKDDSKTVAETKKEETQS